MHESVSFREGRYRPKVWERIANRIYGRVRIQNHLGLVFYKDLTNSSDFGDLGNDVALSIDVGEISAFYERVGRPAAGYKAREWLDSGYHCWAARIENRIVGVQWVWFGECALTGLSGRCFSIRRNVVFSHRIGYSCQLVVDPSARGQGIATSIHRAILAHYQHSKIKGLVATMGAENSAPIKIWTKSGARLIGVVSLRKIFEHVSRKEIFLDMDSVCWRAD